MTGAVMPLLSYGGGAVSGCDLDFEAAQASEANGVDTRPDHAAGTVINESDAWLELFGTEYALVTLGPEFLQLIANDLIGQDQFTSLTVSEWGETFFAEDATYFLDSGATFWIWFTNVNEFVNGGTYCVSLSFE